jgi:fatty acid desaturase
MKEYQLRAIDRAQRELHSAKSRAAGLKVLAFIAVLIVTAVIVFAAPMYGVWFFVTIILAVIALMAIFDVIDEGPHQANVQLERARNLYAVSFE